MSSKLDDRYRLRKRPQSEKLMDTGFKGLAVGLASVVALILVAILIVVFQGGLPSMVRYGWEFLITSDWNPVDDEYGAGAAIYGTLVTSVLSLFIAIPLGIGTAIFITENIIPEKNKKFHRFNGGITSSNSISCSWFMGHLCDGTIHSARSRNALHLFWVVPPI
jgi:phosphate transport system permease protein